MPDRALVFLSDTHCGSTVGLLHPDGVMLDDGQWVYPSEAQGWLYEKYAECIADVKRITQGYHTHLVLNGDLTEGVHHGTHQVISHDKGVHVQAAADVLKDLLALDFETIHLVRGTPAHVDKASGLEKSVAAKLNAEGYPLVRDPATDSFVWPILRMEIEGLLFDVRHHGRSGQREHTGGPYSKWYAQDIYFSHLGDNLRPPDIAIRSHKHRFWDSGPDHRGWTRAVLTPCWQFSTEWVRSLPVESRSSIGAVVVLIRDGEPIVKPLLYVPEPDPQPIWRPAA